MKIEKCRVSQNKVLSLAAKSAIAAALGMSASLALSACDDSSSAKDDEETTPGPQGGDVAPEEQDIVRPDDSESTPESSSQEQAPASSSQVDAASSNSSSSIDIPLSQEPVSSSLMDAISSALESSSSEAEPTSSETVEPASSSSLPTDQEIRDACQGNPGGTPVDIGDQLYLCPDNGGGMMFSMISTFERSDVEA
jgi:hypothetical protein